MSAVPVKQIAEAVERVGGDMDDVADLIATFKRVHAKLAHCNTLDCEGKTDQAEHIYSKLQQDFAKPLSHLAHEIMQQRRTSQVNR